MDNNGMNRLAKSLLIFGVILIIGMIAGMDSSSRCATSGCKNKVESGSSYCYIHKPSYYKVSRSTTSYSNSSSNNTSSGSKTYSSSKNNSSTKSNSTYKSSSPKKSSSSNYKSYEYDPGDYDDPEEYADDAYGVDFDDWDDAYDYWEDY